MPDIITRALLESKGIPTRDIVAAIWGRKLSGGYEPAEATGTLPLTFRSNGTAILDYRIYGSTLTTKLNLWEWGNTNYRIDLTTPIAANTTLTYAVFKDGIANNAERIWLYDANGSQILNTVCANTDGSRIYATVTPTRDVHRIELSPMAADALRMLTEGDTPPDEYISPETVNVQGVGVRTENLFDPNAAEEDGGKIISDFMPLDPSGQYITIAFDIEPRTFYNYEITYYDSTKTAISFMGGMGEAYKTRETVKLNWQSEAQNAAYVKVTLPKDLTNVLIQNGSTSGEYIPYGYKLSLVRRTGNLYDYHNDNFGYFDINGQIRIVSTFPQSWSYSEYISVVPGVKYIALGLGVASSPTYCCIYDKNKNLIDTVQNRMPNTEINVPNDGAYVRLSIRRSKSEYLTAEFIGATDTPIYIGNSQLMQDEHVSYSEQAVYKYHGELTLKGDETNIYYYGIYEGAQTFYIDMPNNSKAVSGLQPDLSCNYYSKTSSIRPAVNKTCRYQSLSNNIWNIGRVYIMDNDYTDLSSFTTHLSELYDAGKPLKIWYTLKNAPIEEDPPVPFPELPTFSNTATVLDYEETPAPEEVWVKYQKGD